MLIVVLFGPAAGDWSGCRSETTKSRARHEDDSNISDNTQETKSSKEKEETRSE